MKKFIFKAEIKSNNHGAFVFFANDVKKEFETKGQVEEKAF